MTGSWPPPDAAGSRVVNRGRGLAHEQAVNMPPPCANCGNRRLGTIEGVEPRSSAMQRAGGC